MASAASKGNERRVLRTWGRTRRDLETGSLRRRLPRGGFAQTGRTSADGTATHADRAACPAQPKPSTEGGSSPQRRMTHITGKPPNRASGDCTRTEDLNSLARIYLRIYLRLPLGSAWAAYAASGARTRMRRRFTTVKPENSNFSRAQQFYASSVNGVGGHTFL